MYEQHFGFSEKPFGITPDPSFLYFSRRHKVAFSMLEYGFYEQDGITVITGEVGVGKTTLLQYLLQQIDHQSYTIGLINNTHHSMGSMLQWIAIAFQLEFEGLNELSLFATIQTFLIEEYAQGRDTVLIIDEAQNMSKESLEELRLLTNINAHKDQLIKIILVGQPQLQQTLQDQDLSQICQRITSEYHLGPLNIDEAKDYVNHRATHAGAGSSIFNQTALEAIHHYSFGIPRLINKLCDYALVIAFARDLDQVDLDCVIEVVNENKLGGFRVPGGEEQLNSVECEAMIDQSNDSGKIDNRQTSVSFV